MLAWACDASSSAAAGKRLSVARGFAVWLQAEDPRHEVPPQHVLGPTTLRRPAPYLLTDAEIGTLMAAALSLPPKGSISPHTWHCIIGLMASTGLRRCEACALRLTDITADGLVVRETKFQKSRLVPLHRSTVDALDRYLAIRRRCGAASDHLFVLSTGRAINPDIVTGMFVKLARQVGLRGGPGEPGPRLHDLRHRFAVRSLEQTVAADRDSANRHMLALATYLGHNSVSSTYWYLRGHARSASRGESPGGIAPPGARRTVRERLRSYSSHHPAAGVSPSRCQWSEQPGARRARPPSQCVTRRRWRRSLLYFRMAHRTNRPLRWRKTEYRADL